MFDNELISKNNAKYFTLKFADISENGVKKITNSFNTQQAKVVEVVASNTAKKKQTGVEKTALFVFANGQTITLFFNESGSVFRVKLNSSIVPVTKLNTISAMTKELVKLMERNQVKFDKALARKAAAAVKDVSKVKAARKSVNQQVQESKEALSSANTNLTNNQKFLSEVKLVDIDTSNQLDTLTKKFKALESEENRLIEELEALGGDI